MTPLGLQGEWHKGHTRGQILCIEDKMVMVQEDYAEGFGLLHYGLYTVDEGFWASF